MCFHGYLQAFYHQMSDILFIWTARAYDWTLFGLIILIVMELASNATGVN